MKRLRSVFFAATFAVLTNPCSAEDHVWTYNPSQNDTGIKTIDGVTITPTYTWKVDESFSAMSGGVQIGKTGHNAISVSYAFTAFPGKIKSVSLTGKTANGNSGDTMVSGTIGDVSLSGLASLTSTEGTITLTPADGTQSGTLSVLIDNPKGDTANSSSQAIYLKTIVVIYGDDSTTTDPSALPAPDSVTASVSGTTVSASWTAVSNAEGYDVTIFTNATATLVFGEELSTSGTSYIERSFTANGITWHASSARSTTGLIKPAANGASQRSLTPAAGSTIEIGPFVNGLDAVSFQYAQPNAGASSFTVSIVTTSGTTQVGSTTTTTGQSSNSDESRIVGDFSATGIGCTESCSILISVSRNALAVDNFTFSTFAEKSSTSTSTTSCSFSNLSPGTALFVAVRATASDASSSDWTRSAIVTTAGNRAPTLVLSAASAAVHAGEPATVTLIGHDDDGDALAYAVSPATYASCLVGNVFTWTPSAVGTTEFAFTVSDGEATSAAETFTVAATLAAPVVVATPSDSHTIALSWAAVPGAEGYRVSGTGITLAGTTVLTESFDGFANFSGTGAITNTMANPTLVDAYTDNAGWQFAYAYRGNAATTGDSAPASVARFGAGSQIGSLTSPMLDLSANGGSIALLFDARRWQHDTTTLDISLDGSPATNLALTDTMTTYALTLSGGTASSSITIAAHAKNNNRFFLDNLRIASGTVTTQTIPAASVAGTSHSATGLVPATEYTFTVTALAHDGEEEVSASATAAANTPADSAPATVFWLE